MRAVLLTWALAAVLVLCFGPASAQQRIGVASVAKNEVAGIIAGQTRVIGTGAQIFQNEVVTTGDNSSAQLLFRDQTTLTLGSNSRMKLDRFVYDPATKTGDIAIDIAEGAFRFMSGDAESQSYKIQTLTATTAVRGTIIAGFVSLSTGQVVIILIEGSCDVTTPAGTVSLQPGDYVVINSDGSIRGPNAWSGGTLLDIDADENFLYDVMGILTLPLGPRWTEENDALDSKNLDERFPEEIIVEEEDDKPMDEYPYGEGQGQFLDVPQPPRSNDEGGNDGDGNDDGENEGRGGEGPDDEGGGLQPSLLIDQGQFQDTIRKPN
jgi:hypothetical protein